MALWHEWVPEVVTINEERKVFYVGPSPDETTLVDFALKNGFEFSETSDTFAKLKFHPKTGFCNGEAETRTFDVHRRMEFNSDRKRMSILLTDPIDGKIKLYTKGADSIIKDRLSTNIDLKTMDAIDDFLARSSVKGLRTLLLSMRVFDKNE